MSYDYKNNDSDSDKGNSGWSHIDFNEIQLGNKIGGGGVGVIYDGYFRGNPVALKTLFDPRLDEQLKQEYLNELLVMSKVNHVSLI